MPTDRTATTWTAAQVLTDVRRKASLPVTSTDWTDAVILREATDVLWSFAGWALAQAGEGRLWSSLDRPVTGALSGALGVREFTAPPLAVAGTLENVTWTDSSGRTQSRLVRVDGAEEGVWWGSQETGAPTMYALLGDRVRIYPIPNSGGTLRFTYQRRHAELVTDVAANVGTVSTVTGTTQATVNMSAAITGLAVGDPIDVIRATHPHAPIVASAEVVTASPLVIDAAAALFTGADAAGARVVRAGQSPYVSLPLEMRAAFTEKVCANILRIVGDLQGMQAAEQAAGLELSRVMQLLSPRSKRDKPFAVNPFSHMRARMGRGRW